MSRHPPRSAPREAAAISGVRPDGSPATENPAPPDSADRREADRGGDGRSGAAVHPVPAVLFDMDGLLVDSEPVWTVAETELAASYGARWTAAIKAECVGRALPDAVSRMLAHFDADPGELPAAMAWLQTRMVELFHGALPMRPGAVALLDGLRSAGVPTALVSSSYRVLVDAALDTLGAWRFDVTLAGDEVTHPKPHPEPYLTAARLLGADPGDCVVFEDSPTGVAAGEAAGCLVVAVPDHAPVPATPTRPVLASLAEVDLDWVLTLRARLRPAV